MQLGPPNSYKMVKKEKPRHKRSLGVQLLDPAAEGVRVNPRLKKRQRRSDEEESEHGDVGALPVTQDLSNAILKEAKAQREELEHEDSGQQEDQTNASCMVAGAVKAALNS